MRESLIPVGLARRLQQDGIVGSELVIQNLHVSVDGRPIVRGVDLRVRQNEVHAVMGPNGSGKSTLAYAISGHPRYKVDQGDIVFDGESLVGKAPNLRAQRGLFLAFQYPVAVSGVTVFNFLRSALNAVKAPVNQEGKREPIPIFEFRELLEQKLKLLQVEDSFVQRYVNEGFSGGEKKKGEILQLAVLEPKMAVLDETDSGLDIDSLKVVAEGVNRLLGPNLGVLLITHYHRILRFIKPHFVHVMVDGKIVRSGGEEVAQMLEEKGYGWVKEGSALSEPNA